MVFISIYLIGFSSSNLIPSLEAPWRWRWGRPFGWMRQCMQTASTCCLIQWRRWKMRRCTFLSVLICRDTCIACMRLGHYSKGWMRALARLRTNYLVTSVHLRGSPENVLFPESILKKTLKKHLGNTTRDGWKIRRSCVPTGWLSFADELNSRDFQNALNHFSFEKKHGKNVNS